MVSLKANQNTLTVHSTRSSIKGGFGHFMQRLKLARRLVNQFFIHCIDAFDDLVRYMRYSNSWYRSENDQQKLEALLFFYYHKVEKSLSLPEVKPIFGLGYIDYLLDLMERWIAVTGQYNAVVFRAAYDTLTCYREHGGEALSEQKPKLVKRIDELLLKYKTDDDAIHLGGTITLPVHQIIPGLSSGSFEQFVHQRHSVRNFTDKPIPDEVIIRAVQLAQKSPSVCNRQCARVHVFTSAEDKVRVLSCQNGNSGFGHLADRVLLVSADLRVFLTSGERNQAYVDAGLFAMTLIYALQAYGVSSCCLNLSHSRGEDRAFRRSSQIPAYEVPVILIAIGYAAESVKVAVSARIPTEVVLSFRNDNANGHN